jgi:hypothetical protein
MEGIPFNQIILNKKPLLECEMVLECNDSNYRLYVDKNMDGNCFYAIAIAFVSCVQEDKWSCPNLKVEPLFDTAAFLDGVRHLEFNRGSEPTERRINYPNLQGIIDMLQKVREIEKEVCPACDRG